MNLSFGQSSAVGPVPFADPADAVGVALSGLVTLPTVPSGPAVPVPGVPNTSLLAQAVADVEGATVGVDGRLVVDPVHLAHDGDRTGWSLEDSAFAMFRLFLGQLAGGSDDDSPDALRVPFLGPVSLALALHEAGVPLVRASALARDVVVYRAVALFESAEADALAVVDSTENRRVIGLLTEQYALRRYSEELERRRRELSGE